MVNLDLALVNRQAEYPGQPVPKEMDLHMVKYMTVLRKQEVEADPDLIQTKPYDHSDIFYNSRTHLNQLGYDTSVYNDSVSGGSDRRKDFYDKIKDVCENYHGVKRHQIGIFPEDRAVMAYKGGYYSVGFENLKTLMVSGTDVIVVEKAGTVLKMVPFTRNRGIAFIQSQGFVSEYGIALAQLANHNYQAAQDFTDGYWPKHAGHLGELMDCDSSGVLIGLKVPGATKIGLDLNSITEIIEFNKNLGIDLEDELDIDALVEGTKQNSHWDGLYGIITRNKKSKAYTALLKDNLSTGLNGLGYIDQAIRYLATKVEDQDGDTISFIEWIKTNRIELNTVLAAIEPEYCWNWLRFKLLKLWPDRDYNRVFTEPRPSDVYTLEIKNFIERLDNTFDPLIKKRYQPIEERLNNIKGFIKDVDGTKKLIQSSMSKTIATNKKIKLVGKRLKALAEELGLAQAG